MRPLETQSPPVPRWRELGGQMRTVLADLPRFATAPLHRRSHCRWGATDEEVTATLPGDDLLPAAQYRCTRAITVAAPAEAVWPWLVQVGCGRGGFYSNDLLDGFGSPSAREIVPELQDLHIGQWVSMSPKPTETTAWKVAAYEERRWLLWQKPDSTWAWRLTPTADGGTRLVTRVHAVYDWHKPLMAILGVLLLELGDYAMMRRMLLGIRSRAEALHRQEAAAAA